MKKIFILLTVLILLFTSCSNNVYIDDAIDNPGREIEKIWRVGDVYFETANAAINYIKEQSQSRSVTRDIDDSCTVYLTRPVLDSKNELGEDYKKYVIEDDSEALSLGLRGSICVPSDFEGDLCIDFDGNRYDFFDNCEAFFVIEGGDNVYIKNGTTVIYNEASHTPYAIVVGTRTVTIDKHLVDDRRVDNKLLYVSENGHLSIENVDGLSGEIALLTDGKTGGELDITSSDITIDNIYTKYKDVNGNVSDKINETVTIDKDAKSKIYIYSGTVTIKAINQKTDYYDVATDTPFERAILNTCGTKENTTIKSAHEIHDIVDKTIENSDGTAEHIVHHTLTHFEKVKATCVKEGNIEYWHCSTCGEYFSDEGKTEIAESAIAIAIDPNAHSLEHTKAKAATCTENGNIEYWHCQLCGKYFRNEDGKTRIEEGETVVEALGHDWDTSKWMYDSNTHWRACRRAGCTAINEEAEHTNEFYYSALTTLEDGTPFLTISHKCSVCGRSVSSEHREEDGVFHLTPLDGFSYTYDKSTGIATIKLSSTEGYTAFKWYGIDGKPIKCLENKTGVSFQPDGKHGFRCELIKNNKVVASCYIELTQYKN